MTGDADRPAWNTYSILFDLFVANQSVARLLDDALRSGPLTPAEYAIYSVVFEEEAVSPTTMAARLGMPLTTIIDQVRAMERRGHLRRRPNPSDRRSFLVVLTGDGLAAHRDAARRFDRAHEALVAALRVDSSVASAHLQALAVAADEARSTLSDPAGSPTGHLPQRGGQRSGRARRTGAATG